MSDNFGELLKQYVEILQNSVKNDKGYSTQDFMTVQPLSIPPSEDSQIEFIWIKNEDK